MKSFTYISHFSLNNIRESKSRMNWEACATCEINRVLAGKTEG
jgi:hypothetical protein